MKTKWSIQWVVLSLFLSVGIAAAQGNAASTSTDGQGTSESSRIKATLTRISVHSEKEGISVEITCNRPVTPTPQMISDPSRLVLDFPDTVSSNPKNRIDVNRDGLKSVRIGVQAINPPSTRVVLDLEQARAYQLVADGSKLTVKLGATTEAEPAAGNSTAQQDVSTVQPSSTQENPSGKQSDLLLQSSAEERGHPGAAHAVNLTSPGASQEVASPEPGSNSGQPAGTPDNTPAMSSVRTDPITPNSGTSTLQTGGSNPTAPGGTGALGFLPSKDNSYGEQQATASEAQDDARPTHLPLQTQTSQTDDPPPPASPDTQPLRLANANLTPDLPSVTVAPTQPEAAPAAGEYVIGEQDVLSIVVWKERELSATVVVRPDGKITLPLVNEIKVIGMTPAQLQALLTEQFRPFLNVPQVTVEVVQINSRKAYLVGEVAKTGTFPLNSSTTVLQIIAAAGGLKDFAKRKDIYVLHNQNGKQVRYRFNYDEVIRGKNPQQNIVLQPGDMVVVP
jgi:polysaccharide biosynthesis/export protein